MIVLCGCEREKMSHKLKTIIFALALARRYQIKCKSSELLRVFRELINGMKCGCAARKENDEQGSMRRR